MQNDQKRLNKINAIKQEIGEDRAREIIWEDLPDEQLGQLAVLRFQQKRIVNNQARSTTTVRNPNTACRYCQKKGHLQKDCFARKRNKAPMVDANGKPYQNQNGNRVNNVIDLKSLPVTKRQTFNQLEAKHYLFEAYTNLSSE
jgi:hypothetical protein